MTQIDKPELFYIKHPLADRNLPEQTLATFSDEDLADYRSEYEEYQVIQHEAVRVVADLGKTCRKYLSVIFDGDNSKPVKYFDRVMRGGECMTDTHAQKYPSPDTVMNRVQNAKEKYCSFLGQDNAPKVGGEDTLQEINNAVAFLMNKGMTLNSDFTISNAVTIAKSMASQEFDDHIHDAKATEIGVVSISQFNVMCGSVPFPFKDYGVRYNRSGHLTLKPISLNATSTEEELDSQISKLLEDDATYAVSFVESDSPTYNLC